MIGSLVVIGRTRLSVPRDAKSAHAAVAAGSANRPKVAVAYGKLPLSFGINRGQTDVQVQFLSRGGGYTLFHIGNEAAPALQIGPSGDEGVDTVDGEVRFHEPVVYQLGTHGSATRAAPTCR